MPYKAAIFDLDGTLINSLTDLAASGNEVLSLYGRNIFPEENYKYFVGNGSRKLIERILPDFSATQVDAALEKYKEIYAKRLYNHTKPYEHIMEMLFALKQRKVLLAVCTNKHVTAANSLMEKLFPPDLFDIIRGVGDGEKPKPAPDNTLDIMRKIGVNSEEVVFIGDTAMDIQTAINCEILPVGVLWGFRKRQELEENGAKIIISDPLQLLDEVDFI